MEASTREGMVSRLLRLGVSDGARSSTGEMAGIGELEAELALLREENARLKVERHRPPGTGHVIERMRSIRPEPPSDSRDDAGEVTSPAHGAQLITECLAMREGLMDACQEVQQAMQGIRGRLGALAGDMQGRTASDRAMPTRFAAPAVETLGIELAAATDASSPELAQSAA